jgi:hypothetical protein
MSGLFHLRLVREHIANVQLPDNVGYCRGILQGWAKALRRGELTQANEVQLHGEFLTKVFGDVLGYRMRTSSGDDGSYELEAEHGFGASRKSADGALGFFGHDKNHVIAPIELKGADQALDTRKGRVQTPVEQAWGYASRAPESKWIIVSNYDETRLYAKDRGWDVYEVFELDTLDTNEGFARFYALLNPKTLLGTHAGACSPLDALLDGSSIAQEQITDKLYKTYRAVRRDLFDELRKRHSNRPQQDLIPLAQTILDRTLFCAFAEDRSLIPAGTIARALSATNPYDHSWSKWRSLRGVFLGLDKGSEILGLPPLNGGLFRPDSEVDELDVSDTICQRFGEIATYDFAEEVSVEVLGHIFEQSVTDLEELRAEATEQSFEDSQKKPSKRRAEGVFYTPGFVTRYLVDLTLGEAFRERESAAFTSIYGPGVRTTKARDLQAWESYRESLRTLRVLDPACGSGAFLIAAFDALSREYDRVNRALARLRGGQVEVFDLTTMVLNENLFGIDLNGESIEITKLSLWLKTAKKNKQLTYLDRNIRRGNSVVDDPLVDPYAFDWKAGHTAQAFLEEKPTDSKRAKAIDARWREGFDVVIGNPPYVRHELLTKYKDHWKQKFECYDGVADLYVYFFERGISVLKPGGRLGFIVSNKWLKAGYAERLRSHLATSTAIERIVDFGHAPIFPDADAFPCILSARKLTNGEAPDPTHEVAVTQFPREELKKSDVPVYVAQHSATFPQKRLTKVGWSLETGGADELFEKMRAIGVPLAQYAGAYPLYGIKTGYNEAFLVDTPTRDRLVHKDPSSTHIFMKFLRGQDISRWTPEWGGLWMIALASSGDHDWPWSRCSDGEAERVFAASYPALFEHFKSKEDRLRKRSDQGKFWWELRSCAYYDKFTKPKLVYQVIQFHPSYAIDDAGHLGNDKTFFLPTRDTWLIATLNSPLMWWHNWRHLTHLKDEALSTISDQLVRIPIAKPHPGHAEQADALVERLVAGNCASHLQRDAVLDLLRIQYGIDKPGNSLTDMTSLSSDEFVREILKRRPKKGATLSVSGQKDLRKLYETEVAPLRERKASMRADERSLSHLVNQAYGLTPADEKLLWETAPPRMPDAR